MISLDTSIQNLETFVFGPKSKPLTEKTQLRKSQYVADNLSLIQEKIDGTKLTVVRTDKNSANFYENWVVSYKGMVLYYKEFEFLNDLEFIKENSIGISQYALVFDHLKKINHKIYLFPKNTEFSIEFSQNKDTLTRTYIHTGDLFLRSYGSTTYSVENGQLTSIVENEITNNDQVERMAGILSMKSFPIWAKGSINTPINARRSIIDTNLNKKFFSNSINFNNPINVINVLSKSVLSMESVLGGVPEGAVLTMNDGRCLKITQPDQYDVSKRNDKKQMYRMDVESENNYFSKIRLLIDELSINEQSTIEENSVVLSQMIRSLPDDQLISLGHTKKTVEQIKDDIHETAKLILIKDSFLKSDMTMIPISGKPFHLGHFKLIQLAASRSSHVVVYLSTTDRSRSGEWPISGKTSFLLWKTFYSNILPDNVSIQLSDNPLQNLFYDLRWVNQRHFLDGQPLKSILLLSDSADIDTNFPRERIQKYANDISSKIHKIGISRCQTIEISGTKMREFLTNGDMHSFIRYLPPVNMLDKKKIWDILWTKNN